MSKKMIVTGGAKKGYGEAITRRLIKEGFGIIASYEIEDEENANRLEKEFSPSGQLTLISVDHTSRESLGSLVKSITDKIDGLVIAQFYFNMEDPNHFDYVSWDKSIFANLTAPNFLVHELSEKFDDGSSIVVITSTEAFIGSFGASAYAVTKAAIHNLVRSFANNMGMRNIRANAVATGWISGVMGTDDVFNMSRQITPLGRLGSPDEIAAVVYFLLSNEASFVNGTVITVDGGYTCVDAIAKYEFEQSHKQKNQHIVYD